MLWKAQFQTCVFEKNKQTNKQKKQQQQQQQQQNILRLQLYSCVYSF